MTALDPGYEEVLGALYLGTVPPFVPQASAARFRAESLRRRIQVSAGIRDAFPRASVYATAILGEAWFQGVCRELIRLPAVPGGRLLTRFHEAAANCAARVADPRIQALCDYDTLVFRGAPYIGSDRDLIRAAADLPEVFALGAFDYNMVLFARHIELLARSQAPASILREYQPIPRRQRVAVYAEPGSRGEKIVARDVSSQLDSLLVIDLATHLTGVE